MAVKQLFSNDASALLAASIDDVETTIQVDAGYGALFPNPGVDEYFVISLENAAGEIEYCKVTARATDLLTVVRGWEDSVAASWTNGVTRVELRNTAGSMRTMIQRGGDTMEGDLYMDSYTIWDAIMQGDTQIIGGGTYGTTFYNANGDAGNAMTIPSDGMSPPLIGDSPILTVNSFDPQSVFTAGMIMMFYGDVNDIPSGWALCDGNNGRPDLRNRFVVGVGSDYVLGDTGGDDFLTGLTTVADGNHDHGGAVTATELTEEMIPPHNHRLYVWQTGGQGNAEAFSTSSAQGLAGDAEGGHTFGYRDTTAAGNQLVEDYGSSGTPTHDHDIAASGTHTHAINTIDNRPPYYALYFIIKTDPEGSYGGVSPGGGGDGSMYDMYNESGCTTYIGGQATLMDDVEANGSAQVQINCCASNVFRHVLTQNVTFLTPNNPISGQVINIILKQGGSGSYTVTWPSNFKFPGGTPPTLSTAVGAKDVLTCQYDSADLEWCCQLSNAFA